MFGLDGLSLSQLFFRHLQLPYKDIIVTGGAGQHSQYQTSDGRYALLERRVSEDPFSILYYPVHTLQLRTYSGKSVGCRSAHSSFLASLVSRVP